MIDLTFEDIKARQIPGCPEYGVTEDGKVFNMRRKVWLRAQPKEGYQHVRLSSYGTFAVHHLVLITYVGPRPEGLLGLHKDDDRHNNHYSNLEWGTHQRNSDQAKLNHRFHKEDGTPIDRQTHTIKRILTAADVREIRQRASKGVSQNKIATEYGVWPRIIRDIVHRISYEYVLDDPEEGVDLGQPPTLREGVPNSQQDTIGRLNFTEDGVSRMHSSFTAEQVRDIRIRAKRGERSSDIADSCGVSYLTILNIVKYKTYARVEDTKEMGEIKADPAVAAESMRRSLKYALTPDQVRDIRRLKAEGNPAGIIANKYGISTTVVYNIIKGLSYKNVPD